MSLWHWLVVAAVIVLLFGRGKISGVMGEFAQGIKAFKKGMAEDEPAKDVAETKPIEDQTAVKPAAAQAAKVDAKAG
jgi:sec-independent protein translocase protein TatA